MPIGIPPCYDGELQTPSYGFVIHLGKVKYPLKAGKGCGGSTHISFGQAFIYPYLYLAEGQAVPQLDY